MDPRKGPTGHICYANIEDRWMRDLQWHFRQSRIGWTLETVRDMDVLARSEGQGKSKGKSFAQRESFKGHCHLGYTAEAVAAGVHHAQGAVYGTTEAKSGVHTGKGTSRPTAKSSGFVGRTVYPGTQTTNTWNVNAGSDAEPSNSTVKGKARRGDNSHRARPLRPAVAKWGTPAPPEPSWPNVFGRGNQHDWPAVSSSVPVKGKGKGTKGPTQGADVTRAYTHASSNRWDDDANDWRPVTDPRNREDWSWH
jgi:hypothetical protein